MADGVRSPENKLRQAREYRRKLPVALRDGNEIKAPQFLIKSLYKLRNARVHGEIGSARRSITGRFLYIPIIPKNIRELCIHLLKGKTGDTLVHIEEIAYSGPNRSRIPIETDHRFRRKSIRHSGAKRSPILVGNRTVFSCRPGSTD